MKVSQTQGIYSVSVKGCSTKCLQKHTCLDPQCWCRAGSRIS